MHRYFNRADIKYHPLGERENLVSIVKSSIPLNLDIKDPGSRIKERIKRIAEEILEAKISKRSIILAFGAHAVKNGLGKIMISFIKNGWLTHIATNGAGIIHDWEFAYQGLSSEDVRENIKEGRFCIWEESGLYLNLALAAGDWQGLGYGESVGAMVSNGGVDIPSSNELSSFITSSADSSADLIKKGAACDLFDLMKQENLSPGKLSIPHPFKEYCLQAEAFKLQVPSTGHPMFGHDLIYTHRTNRGGVIGRTAQRDFLSFVNSVSGLEKGVYLSLGSAVMSPMIFEKSLSMARNAVRRKGGEIRNCHIHVVDLQEETWDWSSGEPPRDNPAYYLRFMKTFNRMGCPVDYTAMDNRDFLVMLHRELKASDG